MASSWGRLPLAYGVYSVTGMYGEVSRGEAVRLLRLAWSLGAHHFDTADVYGGGLGEELLSEAFPGGGVAVATKVGYDFYSSPERPVRRMELDYLVRATRLSLERLGVDKVDLLYLHNPTREAFTSGVAARFLRWARREAADLVGVALGPETDILEEAMLALDTGEADVIQFVYNMLEQEPGRTIALLARERGVRSVARVPHAGGVLDERLRPGEEASVRDHRSLRRGGWYRWAFRVYYERMRPLLEGLPGTPGQKALSFIFSSIPVWSVVIIARSEEELREYMSPESLAEMPRDIVDELRRIYMEEVAGSPEKPEKSLRLAQALGVA